MGIGIHQHHVSQSLQQFLTNDIVLTVLRAQTLGSFCKQELNLRTPWEVIVIFLLSLGGRGGGKGILKPDRGSVM